MKNKKLFKIAAFSLGTAATVIAPVASVVACGAKGSGSNLTNNGSDTTKKAVAVDSVKDFKLSEFDVERNILNTKQFGLLPLSRISHEFETKDSSNNLTPITSATGNISVIKTTLLTHLKDDNKELQDHALVFIDSTVNGIDGTKQSLTNPIQEFKITKKEIISNKARYEELAKQLNDFISANPQNKYSVLTTMTKDETESDSGYIDGEYKVRLYQKPKNSVNLDEVIGILNDKTKFGSDTFALKALGGFTLTFVNAYNNQSADESIYSNFVQKEDDDILGNPDIRDNSTWKNDVAPKVFDFNALKDNTKYSTNYISTEGKSGSSLVQFGSKTGLTAAEIDKFDNNVAEVGNLVLDRKTNQMYLELTVTYASGIKDFYENGSKTPQEKLDNYQAASTETIYIALPEHTSFVSSTDPDTRTKLVDMISQSLKFEELYSNFRDLVNSASSLASNLFEGQGFMGPHLKNILLDDILLLKEGSKYANLIQDKDFLNKLLSNITKTNPNFSEATFNEVLTNFANDGGLPTDPTIGLNSSHVYTFFAFLNIFYTEMDNFMQTTEGKTFEAKLVKQTADQLLLAKNDATFTSQTDKLKTEFGGKSFDAKKLLVDSLTKNNYKTLLSTVSYPETGEVWDKDYSSFSSNISDFKDNKDGTADVTMTLKPAIFSTLKQETVSFKITNILTEAESNQIKSTLSAGISGQTFIDKIMVKDETDLAFLSGGLDATHIDNIRIFTKTPSSMVVIKEDAILSVDSKDKSFDKLVGTSALSYFMTAHPQTTGQVWVFKVKNVDTTGAKPKWDLIVGLRDAATGVESFDDSKVIKIEVK